MLFYYKSKKDFLNSIRVGINSYLKDMENGAIRCNFAGIIERESKSWGQNAKALVELLSKSNLPDDVYVGFEYQIPVGGRIDCVLFGQDKNGQKNMVHVELKQWSNGNVSTYYSGYSFEVVVDGYKSGTKITSHPSAQADEYQNHLLNYIAAFEEKNINLHGFAYCYNYEAGKDVNVLCNEDFEAVTSRCPLYCKDQTEAFAERLHSLLAGGNGEEVCQDILNSEVRPTKRLQDAAKNMFDGKCAKEEFSLVGNQLDAYNSILGAIKNTDKKDEKTVVIVKGGPGTGKSVIAMRLVSGLAKESNNFLNICYATRSTSLLKGYKEILKGVSYADGNECAALDLFKKNVKIKPNLNQRENSIDAVIVDEAHRIENKANDMNDKDKSLKTHLSQIMAMLYVSRVCVFFIDDFQSVNAKEIGTAEKIKQAAANYYNRILKENKNFEEKDLLKYPKKIENAEKLLKKALLSDDEKKISKAENKLHSLTGDYEWGKAWLEAAQPSDMKVNVIEIELEDQFRCNGSNNYIDWLERVLYKSEAKKDVKIDKELYDFQVMDTPQEVYAEVRSHDDYARFADAYKEEMRDGFSYEELNKVTATKTFEQSARLIAGWCWPWANQGNQEDGDLLYEVSIPEYDFAMPWETKAHRQGDFVKKYAENADLWCIQNEGVNQTGCIFSMQGWETDYVGVIIGPDIKYDEASDSLICCPGEMNYGISKSPLKGTENETMLIRNIYRVLLTRGKKGCFVFACDPGVRDYLRRCMND